MPTPRAATILVVDDQDSVRVATRRQLVALGHTVLEASDGPEALGLVRQRAGKLDLVLTDVVMPEMNGTELAAALVGEFPGLPIVLMSGYAPPGLTRVGFGETIVPVLQKPLDLNQLAELVETVLDLPGRRRPSRPGVTLPG
jgi:CheY-like chemotaxis protein